MWDAGAAGDYNILNSEESNSEEVEDHEEHENEDCRDGDLLEESQSESSINKSFHFLEEHSLIDFMDLDDEYIITAGNLILPRASKPNGHSSLFHAVRQYRHAVLIIRHGRCRLFASGKSTDLGWSRTRNLGYRRKSGKFNLSGPLDSHPKRPMDKPALLSRVSSFKWLLIFVTNCPAEENACSDSVLVGVIFIKQEYVLFRSPSIFEKDISF
ncbi:hypothetical protein TNCV_4867611 [Trichonephila clavipes]|nr:hypothetical protein TNCV_4867611 [Trichonephila clavipes]